MDVLVYPVCFHGEWVQIRQLFKGVLAPRTSPFRLDSLERLFIWWISGLLLYRNPGDCKGRAFQ